MDESIWPQLVKISLFKCRQVGERGEGKKAEKAVEK